MPEQALYLKWRPLAFEDVRGQEHITRTLRNSLKTGRIRHAYLFSGPRGTGKTTTARLLSKAVNCKHEDSENRPCNQCLNCVAVNENRFLDLIEIDAATHTGVDDVRDLRDKIAFTPGEGQYKVYIIDEVHRFTGNAFDALLKTLEEPPDHAIFVLATTEIDKVPATIKSRCLQFEFRRVALNQIADRLETIVKAEGLKIDRTALELIARQGTGSVRDSISLLDQMVSDPNEHLTLEITQHLLGTASSAAVRELVEALITANIARGLNIINSAIDSGNDPRQFAQQVVEHLRALLLAKTSSTDLIEASSEDRESYNTQSKLIERTPLIKAIRLFNEAVNDYKSGWQPQLALELALMDSVRAQEEPEPVMQQIIVQQHPGQQKTAPPERFEATPDKPPVIQPSVIQDRWEDMLKAMHKYSRSGPDVVQNFRVQRVDGNIVYLCTNNNFLYGRLNGQDEKLHVIEKALWDVHKMRLNVQVILVDNLAKTENDDGKSGTIDDPLISQALELGAKIDTIETTQPPPED